MFIYHSKTAPVRVTVVGEYDESLAEISLAVSRCSKRDDFLKKTIIIPERPAFTVQTKNGPKIIPARAEKIFKGGTNIATERLENGEIFAIFPMKTFSQRHFNIIATGIADLVINNPQLVEEIKHGK